MTVLWTPGVTEETWTNIATDDEEEGKSGVQLGNKKAESIKKSESRKAENAERLSTKMNTGRGTSSFSWQTLQVPCQANVHSPRASVSAFEV